MARFELFVAWRYLRDRGKTSRVLGWVALSIGLLAAAVAIGAFILGWKTRPLDPGQIYDGARDWKRLFQLVGVIAAATSVAWLVGWFYYSLQSFFSTISTYGVFLGTTALVIILSVMNGFEVDLRKKILGSNAHILVTKEDGPFVDWEPIQAQLAGVCARGNCVRATSPYLTSEVVIAANSNYAGVIIKGIVPETVGTVTDLEKNLSQKDALPKLWPVLPDGGAGRYEAPATPPDAGALDAGPDRTPDAGDPTDFSGEADAPAEAPAPVREATRLLGLDAGPDAGPEGDDLDDEPPPPDFSVPTEVAGGGGGPDEVLIRELDPFEDGPRRRPIPIDPRVQSLDGVLVGRELSKNLHLYVGQEVQIVSPLGQDTPAGQIPRTRPFRVAGMFYTGMYEYDTKFVYVSLPSLQKFLSIGGEVSGIEVKVSDMDETGPLVQALRQKLGPDYRVQDWKEINRNLFSALKLEKIAMFSVLANIIVVACLSIILNLIMVVVEKGKEIATLKGMGATDGAVMRIFMIEGLYIGTLGTGFGIIVGVLTCLSLEKWGLPLDPEVYYIDQLPVAMDPFAIVMVAVAGIGISVIATLYPSYVASRLRPVEGLRFH